MFQGQGRNLLRSLDTATRRLARPKKDRKVTPAHGEQAKRIFQAFGLLPIATLASASAVHIVNQLNPRFFEDKVFRRKEDEALRILKELLTLPLEPSTRIHIWVASLLGLDEKAARQEATFVQELLGSRSPEWNEVKRILRCHLTGSEGVPAQCFFEEISDFSRVPAPSEPQPDPSTHSLLRLEHPISSRTIKSEQMVPQAARLVWKRMEENIGTVHCPVRLTLPPGKAGTIVTIQLDAVSLNVSAVRESYIDPNRIELQAQEAKHDLSIKLFLPREICFGKRLSLALIVTLPGEQRKTNIVNWENISEGMPTLRALLPDAVDPERVKDRPLGIEVKYADVCDLLKSDKSILLYAPRRFGKTSLLKTLSATLEQDPEVKLFGPFNALLHPESNEFWGSVFDEMRTDRDWVVDGRLDDTCGLPTHAAFENVRSSAKSRGIKRLFILIDEAQALFRGTRGIAIGNELKSRLEAWGGSGEALAVMQRLKAEFDPRGFMNPGRFLGGI